ncbi:MAG: hypothetical protein DWI57_08780 [Chloroflexi bacterium]|nr:MAG: hypothetical protein DWI57_08780 [Chloroflexota bacterium]
MGLKRKITEFVAGLFLERPTQDKSYAELAQQLEEAGQSIEARLSERKYTEFNHRVLTHIIGIECWGQSRLRVFLGDPFVQDEYNGYRPARDVPWDELVGQFASTRSETISLARGLNSASVAPDKTVLHNQLGSLSARAWLRYLQTHASREIMQVR